MSEEKIVKTTCLLCPLSCGIDVHVKDNKPVKVESMPESVIGPICIKAEVIPEWYETELKNRLLHPLEKVNGSWREITWDQALDTIADKAMEIKQKYGPESLAIFPGQPEPMFDFNYLTMRFALAYGTPNYHTGASFCYFVKIASSLATVGDYITTNIGGSKSILVWGANPTESVPFAADRIMLLKTQGALKLIVIDPRRTLLAKAADIWLQVRPGTDGALGLGFINVIISEGLYDKEFVEKHTLGFDKLVEHVKPYSPEKVEEITWVAADKIREAARMYAINKPSTIFFGNCFDNSENGFQTCRVEHTLMAITGNLDVRGGSNVTPIQEVFFPKWAIEDTIEEGLPMPKVEAIDANSYPLFSEILNEPPSVGLVHGMLGEGPYPIKMLLVQAGNPLMTLGDTNKFKRGLDNLDFLVVQDIVMTELAERADIVLPGANCLEQPRIYQGTNRPLILYVEKAIEPPEDCWPQWKLWMELGKRMGYEKYLPWKDLAEFENELLQKRFNITLDQLKATPEGHFYGGGRERKKYESQGFRTPSGKVEIYSEKLEKLGYDPLPTFHEHTESPVGNPNLARKYPLILITGHRELEFEHYQLRGVPTLRARRTEPLVQINTDTAAKLGIESGDMVIIETIRGRIEMKAAVTQDIHPQVVSVPHGWGGLANQNYLTSFDIRCPEMGTPTMRALLCRVTKASVDNSHKFITL